MDSADLEKRVWGTLRAETPFEPRGCEFYGDCSVGALTYMGWTGSFSEVDIGRYCSIAKDVIVGPGNHSTNHLSTHPFAMDMIGLQTGMGDTDVYQSRRISQHSAPGATRGARTSIGHDVWIGARAIILSGVRVGHGAIIGAGAVVSRDVEPYAVVVGNPARAVRHRLPEGQQRALLELAWWDYDLSRIANRDWTDVARSIDILRTAIDAGLPKWRPAVVEVGARATA